MLAEGIPLKSYSQEPLENGLYGSGLWDLKGLRVLKSWFVMEGSEHLTMTQ